MKISQINLFGKYTSIELQSTVVCKRQLIMNNNTTILKLLLAVFLIFGCFNLAYAKSKKKKL
ncbi:MAG: hypothetical protein RIF34_11855, partial [Candidatus Kapaibacterium sp.]